MSVAKMKTCRIVLCAVFASVVLACGGEEGDSSLERVKANFVRVLRDSNALVYSEIAKMGGVPPVADSNIRTVAESGGVSEKHVERLIRAQRADGSWPSVDYTTALRSQWPANEHLKNLKNPRRRAPHARDGTGVPQGAGVLAERTLPQPQLVVEPDRRPAQRRCERAPDGRRAHRRGTRGRREADAGEPHPDDRAEQGLARGTERFLVPPHGIDAGSTRRRPRLRNHDPARREAVRDLLRLARWDKDH